MSLQIQVLGNPGRDNALWVQVNSGQRSVSLLFDCGQGCLSRLSHSEVQDVDHVFFSHFHMDHIAGFDSFFRANFNRASKPVRLWGPAKTIEIMHHRFRGFWWNLHRDQPGIWEVNEVHRDRVTTSRFRTCEAFENAEPVEPRFHQGEILADADFTVEAIQLQHHGISLGYLVRETTRQNVDSGKLIASGLKPGPWVKRLKEGDREIEIEGTIFDGDLLRTGLLVETPGNSVAYLTDFLLDEETRDRLKAWLHDCDTLVGEAQYQHADLELATRNHHTTTRQVAELAKSTALHELVLFHLSQRYHPGEWLSMLKESRTIFPKTRFPAHWKF